jgi:hypothetical protein
MTHGGVLGGMLQDIGGTFGIVSFKWNVNRVESGWRMVDTSNVLASEIPEDGL